MAKTKSTKQTMFELYAASARLSGYSTDAVYFCPLCDARFDTTAGLTVDHIPFAALGVRSLTILACARCNNDSGKAQNHLLQARRLHALNGAGPTPEYRFRLTLENATVVAHVAKTVAGSYRVRLDDKRNNPDSVRRFTAVFSSLPQRFQWMVLTSPALHSGQNSRGRWS